ncbi:MBL fold metallo-hydrolase [Aliivibrio finisterrensis]|uniref:MBL fold metallo-hydrolase RNA specificity domain-containing protein n=1 Tax=Aliivibrio finisterrensis TaxID=511998 RepID=UPI0010217644|nr:MBL fold metallo-hydrolase [Aliivibrio finisterrensis]RYU67833.1 MBL fold metallo-hydrolase [Aliivibrio finisterrensis]RYU71492.1 MBL fold metallo-hydrolase [Aliivibrio finisterrensis]RYU74654.1 MBL fold metallo-hydrolase [Aliivibrio finisterrensis]
MPIPPKNSTQTTNLKTTLKHHGGKLGVTGSCHELNINNNGNNHGILIDCGLFQGKDAKDKHGNDKKLDIEFPISHLKALILTHTHIDHIGRLPWLLAKGFKQPIYCTPATAELVPLMLDDGLKLQLGLNKGQRTRVLELIKKQIKPIPYNQWHRIALSSRSCSKSSHSALKAKRPEPLNLLLRFQPAGHILGSAYVEIKLPNNEIVVFSGDLGPSNTPLLPDPIPPKRADLLVIESTYGNKLHDNVETRAKRLQEIIERSLQDGGAIIIPAFSVGRTQELLFDIEHLIHHQKIDSKIPIILDSPLANKVTKQYRRFKKLWSKEAKTKINNQRHPLNFDQCITIESHKEHMRVVNRLKSTAEPCIIVAASGMCAGGRVMNYLEVLLPDKRTDIILAGYQAHGTLGRDLQNQKSRVWIDNQPIDVSAQIHTMSGYSAHADQADLIKFVDGIEEGRKEVVVVHGEREAREALCAALT